MASPPSQNPKGIPETLKAIIDLLKSARSTIKIQVYQYTTSIYDSPEHWKVLDSEIRKAAGRGVRVQLLVDAVSLKSGGDDLKALAAIKGIQVRTVVIPQWSGGPLQYARLIHSKYFRSMGLAWVGTENWSKGYFDNM